MMSFFHFLDILSVIRYCSKKNVKPLVSEHRSTSDPDNDLRCSEHGVAVFFELVYVTSAESIV